MNEEEKKAIKYIKYLKNNIYIPSEKKHRESLETILNLIEKQQKEIEKLKEKLNNSRKYIENEMYVDENPTICGEEEDSFIELPISLHLYNEDLRELLELLEEK